MEKVVLRGFEALVQLPQDRREAVLRTFIDRLGRGDDPPEVKTIAEQFDLPEDSAQSLAVAVSYMILTMSSGDEPAQDFVNAVVDKKLLEQASATILTPLAEIVQSQRAALKDALESVRLGSEVLPSLDSFEVAVDLRVKLGGTKVLKAVPVAVLHIDTSAFNQEIWLQATKGQVESLVRKLQDAVKSMETVEAWAASLRERR